MLKTCLFLLLLAGSGAAFAQPAAPLSARLANVELTFALGADGRPTYALTYRQKPVVRPSRLGIRLADGADFDGPMTLTGSETTDMDDTWQPVWSEVKSNRNCYRQLTVHLRQAAAPGRRLDVVFRVFANGLGFRYEFPKQPGLQFFTVAEKLTEFALYANAPDADWNTNPEAYRISRQTVRAGRKLRVALTPGGGATLSLVPAE